MKEDTPDILREIVAHKHQEVSLRMRRQPHDVVRELADQGPEVRNFYDALVASLESGAPAVIAECKKASPSRGVIRIDYDPAAIAQSYAAAGAVCLSVLTDMRYFQGTDEHLQQARAACALPVLRKDFIVDPYQIYEARAIGADCILLIAASLDDHELLDFAALAHELKMEVLVEIHDREELERALLLRVPLLGINNRDLRNFETHLDTTLRLLIDIVPDRLVVSESGIHSRADVELLRRNGVHAFLVGEAFMSAPDPGAKLRELFG